ncbi:hypothetical protein, partial [Paraglaciecola sp.]|uniref:hypothetical protein n=1 Tax=Paraglaciecola sp. TaxID=1920173 RepID=UPI0030F3E12B
MQRIMILIGHFFAASLLTFLLASIVHSQFVIHALVAIDIEVSYLDRLGMTIQDIQGLFPTLGPIISFSLLCGFLLVTLLNKFKPSANQYNYLLLPLAGGVALWLMIIAMHPIMNITLIASARSSAGIMSLSMCGVLGGWVFWRLR